MNYYLTTGENCLKSQFPLNILRWRYVPAALTACPTLDLAMNFIQSSISFSFSSSTTEKFNKM